MKPSLVLIRLLLPLGLLTAFACHRSDPAPTPPLTTSITLAEPVVQNDTTAVLNWSTLNNPDFKRYVVLRKDPTYTQFTGIYNNANSTYSSYADKALPYDNDVQYQVMGELTSGQVIASNVVVCRRPQIKTVTTDMFHVLFENQSRTLLFFSETGTLTQVDVASGQVRQTLSLGPGPIGYAGFGQYQGVKELYIPMRDGRVLIYNAATLTKVDEIITDGNYLQEVLAAGGLLYVSTRQYAAAGQPMVFSRASKQLITRAFSSFPWTMRMYGLPTDPTSFIGVSRSIAPTDQALFSFSTTGSFLRATADKYHGTYPLDAQLFEFFPAGDRYITGIEGGIYSRQMDFLAQLAPRAEFACYGFDPVAGTLYAGTNKPVVRRYDLATYALKSVVKLPRYPFRLFKDPAGGFVCLELIAAPENFFFGNTSPTGRIFLEHLD